MKKISNETILAALISCGSIRKAAAVAQCSEATIRQRLKNDAFNKEYTDAKQTILTEACDALSARLTLAVDTLCEIIEDKETSNTIKVSASDALLRHGLRYVEAVNIVKRIEALEAITEEE